MLRAGARIPPGIVGSSPLTRGKRVRSLDNLGQVGLIPAHAGKTRPVAGASGWVEAHPRSRGENLAILAAHADGGGSSPLTRGKHVSQGRLNEYDRLIPAHAGKTTTNSVATWWTRAHPRSRGENTALTWADISGLGSSPLTRGKQDLRVEESANDRLIPAHAGKTLGRRQPPVTYSAHPRSRGENLSDGHELACARGSSPLTRGKRFLSVSEGASLPAHPRSRGENVSFLFRREPLSRLIPAHAGKTPRRSSPHSTRTAHPRSRGENSVVG